MFRSVAFFPFLFCSYLGATTIAATWNDGTGNWTNSGNWSFDSTCAGCVPNNGGNDFNVTIAPSGGGTITLDLTATVDSLTLGDSTNPVILSAASFELTTTGDLTVKQNAALQVPSGGAGDIQVGGNALVTGGGALQIENNSFLNVTGNLTIDSSSQVVTNWEGGTPPALTANTVIVGGNLTVNANGSFVVGNGDNTTDLAVIDGTFSNSGTVFVGTGATLGISGGISTIVDGSLFNVGGTLDAFSSLAAINGGELILRNATTTTITGDLSVTSGTQAINLDLDDGTTLHVTGDLTNSGNIYTNDLSKGGSNQLTIDGTLNNSGQVRIGVGVGNASDTLQIGTLNATAGSQVIVGTAFGSGISTLILGTGLTTIPINTDLEIYGDQQLIGGGSALAGLTTISGNLILANGQTTTVPGGLTVNSGTTLFGAINLDIDNSSTFHVTGDATNSGNIYTNDLSLGGSNQLTIDGTLNNSGDLRIGVGNGNASDTATIGTLNATAGSRVIVGTSFGTGTSTLELGTGLTTIPVNTDLEVYGNQQLIASGSALAGLTTINGNLILANGQTTTVPGGLTVNSGTSLFGAINLDIDKSSTLHVTGDVTNSGNIYTNDLGLGGSNQLTIDGTLNNSGDLRIGVGTGNASDTATIGTLNATAGSRVIVGTSFGTGTSTLELGTGLTTIPVNTDLEVYGNQQLIASGSALAGLTTINGNLILANGQTTTVPGGLTVNSGTSLFGAINLDIDKSSTLHVTGDVTNSGNIYTNDLGLGGSNQLTIDGTLNNSGDLRIGVGTGNASDTATIGTLNATAGSRVIVGTSFGTGTSTLELGTGLTTIPINTDLEIYGNQQLIASGSALAGLTTINGNLFLANGQTTTVPGGLAVNSGTSLFGAINLDIDNSSTLHVTGDVTNSGNIYTNDLGLGGSNQLTIDGTLNNSGDLRIGVGTGNASDTAQIGTLNATAGSRVIVGTSFGSGTSTLKLGTGLTTIPINTDLEIYGNQQLTAGGSALAGLTTIDGNLTLANGQTTTVTGDLAVNSGTSFFGVINLDIDNSSTLHVTGDLTNSGQIYTNNLSLGGSNQLTIDGTLNNSGGVRIGGGNGTSNDVASVTVLVNAGVVTISVGELFVGTGTPPALGAGLAEYYQSGTLEEIFNADSTFGTIDVTGDGFAVLNGGTLVIGTLPGGFAPSLGTTYDIIKFTGGDLTLMNGGLSFTSPTFNGGDSFNLNYDNTDGFVQLIVAGPSEAPEPASVFLTAAGLMALGYEARRRARRRATHR